MSQPIRAQKCIKSGSVKLVGWDALLRSGSNIIPEIPTGGICAYVGMGSLITSLVLYMPFLYVARSSDPQGSSVLLVTFCFTGKYTLYRPVRAAS